LPLFDAVACPTLLSNTISVICERSEHKTPQTALKHAYIDDPLDDPVSRITARLVGCSLGAPWAGVANSQTDRHRAKVTVGAYMWALSCRSLFGRKIVKITELFAFFWQF